MMSLKEFTSRLELNELPDNTLFSAYCNNNIMWWARTYQEELFLCAAQELPHVVSIYDKYQKTFDKNRYVATYPFSAVRKSYRYSADVITFKIHSIRVTHTKPL